MTDGDLKKIGDEMIRIVEPIYEDLGEIKKQLNEHTDKIDALMVEVHGIHQEIAVDRDKTISEIDKIKERLGLPTSINS